MRLGKTLVAGVAVIVAALAPPAGAETGLGAEQLVEIALEANPQVRSARARYDAARHQIKQAYAPNDPVYTFINGDSPTNGITSASFHSTQITESFQFPGKALLQTGQARRTARIARFAYEATRRDIRAATKAAYYQALLDGALGQVAGENAANLARVLQVTQVAYSANRVTQTDFISAEFDLAAARQTARQQRVAEANDETALDQLLYRPPGAPLNLDRALKLEPLRVSLATLIDEAASVRQEILEAALAERNSETALELARMEYLPDFTAAYIFDHYLLASAAPAPTLTQDHGFLIGFNLPVFFWLKQNEDVKSARFALAAARADFGSIRSQTAAAVTQLYRSVQFAYETALLYRDSLVPLAGQDFQVALVAYQSGKVDFVTLAGALRRSYDSRVSYLQAANQYLAGRVALEQAIGAPLPR